MTVHHVARDGDWVIHRGTVDGQFAVGDACELNVDGAVRSNHTRLHTGGELICAALAEMNVRYPISGAMHYPGQCKVVLDVALHDADRAQLFEALRRTVTQLIVADVPVAITHDRTFGERTSDAVMAGGMRYVSIGDLNRRPCLGTHTRSAAEIGNLKILGIKSRKGETRISYDIETT
jgi:alanyl-tRNA synthetase